MRIVLLLLLTSLFCVAKDFSDLEEIAPKPCFADAVDLSHLPFSVDRIYNSSQGRVLKVEADTTSWRPYTKDRGMTRCIDHILKAIPRLLKEEKIVLSLQGSAPGSCLYDQTVGHLMGRLCDKGLLPHIISLSLGNNSFTDTGVGYMVAYLSEMSSLKQLELGRNNVFKGGALQLKNALLQNNITLTRIVWPYNDEESFVHFIGLLRVQTHLLSSDNGFELEGRMGDLKSCEAKEKIRRVILGVLQMAQPRLPVAQTQVGLKR